MKDRATDTPAPDRSFLPRLGVFGLMLGIFLATLDGQIVSTALTTIVGDLSGLDHFSWSVTAYLFTMAASTPIWGKLGDLSAARAPTRTPWCSSWLGRRCAAWHRTWASSSSSVPSRASARAA